jgi:hypothetical protein
MTVRHLTMQELEAGLDEIRRSPDDEGTLEMIVRRPRTDARETLEEGELDAYGLVGDRWGARAREKQLQDLEAGTQLTLMNARAAALVAQDRSRWPLAGDQLFVDLSLGTANLPVGSVLSIGSAVLEISEQPHTGCSKFSARFGPEALAFVNSPDGRALRLRGVYARVLQPGTVRVGDVVTKIEGD